MGVAFDGINSPLIIESEHGIWQAGRRCPDIVLRATEHTNETRLYSTVKYGQFSVLSVGAALNEGWPNLPISLARYTIFSADRSEYRVSCGTISGKGLTFESPDVALDERCVAVVRPDMYVGFVGSKAEAISYLSKTVLGLEL